MCESAPGGFGRAAMEKTAVGGTAAVSRGYWLWGFVSSRRRHGVDGRNPLGGEAQTAAPAKG